MSSAGIQADISDPEGILGVIRSLYGQLQDLSDANQSLLQMRKAREERVQTHSELSNQLTERLTNLLSSAQTMERSIQEDTESITSTDQELQDLLNEKERLDAIVGGQLHVVSDGDFANEERLTGFVEEELSRKIDELSNLRTRLDRAREEYKSEWDQFKTEVRQYEEDKSSYEEKADHLQELQLAKFVGAHSGSNGSGGALIKRLVQHHLNQLTHRDLQKQVTESRVKEKDLESEIGDYVKQKQQLWKRCLDLERSLEEIQDTSDETNMLRPASAFSALPDVTEGVYPTSGASDLDLSAEHVHGRMLHRCHKNVNLVVDLSAEEREDYEATIQTDVGPTDTAQVSHVEQTPEATTTAANDSEEPEEQGPSDESTTHTRHDLDSVVETPQTDETTAALVKQLPAHIKDAVGNAADNTTFVNKLRKRVGLAGRSSSSQRIKGTPKLTATGSTRHFDPSSFLRRKR